MAGHPELSTTIISFLSEFGRLLKLMKNQDLGLEYEYNAPKGFNYLEQREALKCRMIDCVAIKMSGDY